MAAGYQTESLAAFFGGRPFYLPKWAYFAIFLGLKYMNEFAIIATGGKQYKVSKGDTVKIEKMTGTFKVGDKIVFDKVLLVDDGKDATIGTPYIAKASVEATLSEVGRNKTVEVVKYKQKSRYYKKNGHRQPWFKVLINTIK